MSKTSSLHTKKWNRHLGLSLGHRHLGAFQELRYQGTMADTSAGSAGEGSHCTERPRWPAGPLSLPASPRPHTLPPVLGATTRLTQGTGEGCRSRVVREELRQGTEQPLTPRTGTRLQGDRLPKSPGDQGQSGGGSDSSSFLLQATGTARKKKKKKKKGVRDTLCFNSARVCSTWCIYELSGESSG